MKSILTFLMLTVLVCLSISCDKVGPTDKYSGITHTGEDSPNPIGEPDPDDWKPIPLMGLTVYPAFPNPTDPYSTLKFHIDNQLKIKIVLDDPANDKRITYFDAERDSGSYAIYLDFNYQPVERPLDTMIRVFIYATKDNTTMSTHGDIRIIWK